MERRRPFVALRRVEERAIKEVIEQVVQFLLLMKFQNRIRQPVSANIIPQVVFRQNQSPDDFAQRYALVEALLPELVMPVLQRIVRLLRQPSPQVVVHTLYTR